MPKYEDKFENLHSTSIKFKELDDDFNLSLFLKKKRIEKRMNRNELAKKVGTTQQQIQRYESQNSKYHQEPCMSVMRKICVILEFDPRELFHMKMIRNVDDPDLGVIYDYTYKPEINILKWKCISCGCVNIEYGVLEIKTGNVECYCEKCGSGFLTLFKFKR